MFFYMINFNGKCSTPWTCHNLFLSTPLCDHLFPLFSATEHSYGLISAHILNFSFPYLMRLITRGNKVREREAGERHSARSSQAQPLGPHPTKCYVSAPWERAGWATSMWGGRILPRWGVQGTAAGVNLATGGKRPGASSWLGVLSPPAGDGGSQGPSLELYPGNRRRGGQSISQQTLS